jgi:hypothetical protein
MTNDALAQLQKYLIDEDYKKLLSFCMEPKQWGEISKLGIKQSKIFQMLKDLKTIEALEFSGGKYLTAANVVTLLR